MTEPQQGTAEPPATETDEAPIAAIRRRFLAWSVAAAAVATVLFGVVLAGSRDSWFHGDLFGGFYDAQARSLLEGRIDVDPDVPGIEGFRIGDRTYIYQGLTPALARLPIVAATDRFDGRLTGVSMLAGFIASMAAVVALGWKLRSTMRGAAPLDTTEGVATAAITFAAGGGTLLFLASKAWVYHEALLWGAALTLGSLTALVYWAADTPLAPTRLRRPWLMLGTSAALGALALNTRSSMGIGPYVALGIVFVVLVLAPSASTGSGALQRATSWLSRVSGMRDATAATTRPRALAAVVAAVLGAGLLLYMGVNQARFGSPMSIPLDKQVLVAADPLRTQALDANDGSLFGVGYAPSVVFQVLRPDALALRGEFPFVGFGDRPSVVGDALFAELDWSSSAPSSNPVLFLASLAGLVALIVPGRVVPDRAAGAVRAQRVAVLGAAASGAAIAVFGYIAQRYLADVFVFLAVCGLVGFHALAARWAPADRSTVRTPRDAAPVLRWVGVLVVVVLALWTGWVNMSLALQYGKEIAPGLNEATRAAWIRTQNHLGSSFDTRRIDAEAATPPAGAPGQLLVVGDCDALYRSSGKQWYLVELGEAGGALNLTLTPHEVPSAPVVVVDVAGDATAGPVEVIVEPDDAGRHRLVVVSVVDGNRVRSLVGPSFDVVPGEALAWSVIVDRRSGLVSVATSDDPDDELLRVELALPQTRPSVMGDDTITVTESEVTTPTCRTVTA